MIERPPVITDQNLAIVMLDKSKRPNEKLSALIDKINDDYEYWDTVKYKNRPEGCASAQELWLRVKASRISCTVFAWDKYNVNFGHSSPIGIIPYGIECELDVDNKKITLLESIVK